MARISLDRRLDLITRAAAAGRPVEITYDCGKDGQVETRVIEIHEMWISKDGNWIVRAYCRLRDETRTFRVDRILAHRTRRLTWQGPAPKVTPMFSMFGTPTSTAYEPKKRTYTAGGLLASLRERITQAADAA
jgi:predicted DNA-binding transcriptional regulator YafY